MRVIIDDINELPNLLNCTILVIRNIPNKYIPRLHLPKVHTMIISDNANLRVFIKPYTPNLRVLTFVRNPKLKQIPNFGKLRYLNLKNNGLRTVPKFTAKYVSLIGNPLRRTATFNSKVVITKQKNIHTNALFIVCFIILTLLYVRTTFIHSNVNSFHIR